MNIGTPNDFKTLQEAINQLANMRQHFPFRFSGKFFMAILNGQAVAYRSKQALINRAMRDRVVGQLEMAIVK